MKEKVGQIKQVFKTPYKWGDRTGTMGSEQNVKHLLSSIRNWTMGITMKKENWENIPNWGGQKKREWAGLDRRV